MIIFPFTLKASLFYESVASYITARLKKWWMQLETHRSSFKYCQVVRDVSYN